jgi:uncharacterized membrane protein YGL010W
MRADVTALEGNSPSKLQQLFQDYQGYHTHPLNKVTHYLGIPMIVFSIIVYLNAVIVYTFNGMPPTQISLAHLAMVLVVLYYFSLHRFLALIMAAFFAVLYGLGHFVQDLWVVHGLFLGGWILQFVGHGVFEKRSPAFTQNGLHLLVGPLWIVSNWLKRVGLKHI